MSIRSIQLAAIALAASAPGAAACPFADKIAGASMDAAAVDEIHRGLLDVAPPPTLPNAVCALGATNMNPSAMCRIAKKINKAFKNKIKGLSKKEKSQLHGASVRLAFHDAGEIDIRTGDSLGPDGCLQRVTSENAGLVEGDQEVTLDLEPIWQEFCKKISRADFWALWAKFVVEKAATEPITVDYYFGRTDNAECDAGSGRLPSAGMGLDEIERVFVDQMGLSMDDAVALIGAHSLGHMSPSFSGFGHPESDERSGELNFNAWDNDPHRLNNNFYRSLLNVRWDIDPADAEHEQDYIDNNSPRVMLNSDMSLGFIIDSDGDGSPDRNGCGGAAPPKPPPTALRRRLQAPPPPPPPPACERQPLTAALVDAFADDNALFLSAFAKAFTKMSNVGYGYTDGTDVYTGKLGTLTKLECDA